MAAGNSSKCPPRLDNTYAAGAWLCRPYLLGNHLSLGANVFYRESLTNSYQSYGRSAYGGDIKVGAPLTDDLGAQVHYSLINQSLSLAPELMDCSPANPPPSCFGNGEASAVVKQAALNGPAWTSTVGSTLTYSSLDNPRKPSDGIRADLRQDIAGLGGSNDFFKTTGDVRYYKNLGNNIVAMTRLARRHHRAVRRTDPAFPEQLLRRPPACARLRAERFWPARSHARHHHGQRRRQQLLGDLGATGGACAGLPPGTGLRGAIFADAGSLWGYRGQTSFPGMSQSFTPANSRQVRSSVGASLIWDSPLGPLHVNYALPLSKTNYDLTQRLNFGAGPSDTRRAWRRPVGYELARTECSHYLAAAWPTHSNPSPACGGGWPPKAAGWEIVANQMAGQQPCANE